MSTRGKVDVSDLVERLSKAKVINTDVSLKATLDAVSAGSSLALEPWDIWCGTIRRPWVIIRYRQDLEEQIGDLNVAIRDLKEVAKGISTQRG